METSLADFSQAWELLRDSALSGAVAGALLGTLGVYVVLRRMVFLSAALSQAAGLGIAMTLYLHLLLDTHDLSPTAGAMVTTLLATSLVLFDRSTLGGRRDSLLGFAYLIGAAGTLAIGTRIVEEIQDIESLLFGSAVAVAPADFHLLTGLAVGVVALHVWWMRGFILASFDRDGARVRGLPVRALDAVLIGLLAISTSVCTRVLGALPVLAFTVLPAMAAVRVSANVPRALVTAGLLGGLAGLLGYIGAYLYQVPVGAAQTLVAATFVPLAHLGGRIGERLRRRSRA